MRKLSEPILATIALAVVAWPATAQQANYGSAIAAGDGEVFVSEPMSQLRAGTVWMYRSSGPGGEWTEAGSITAPDAHPRDGFGTAMAVDGSVMLVSRLSDEDPAAVFAFERSGDEWTSTGQLPLPADTAPARRPGTALALDGNTALVTASAEDEDSTTSAVYVFERDGGDWTQTGTLTGYDVSPGDEFGEALAIADGRAVVGAPGQGNDRGAAYLFDRGANGEWTGTAKLVSRTVTGGSALGQSVALLGDRPVVAAPGRDEATGAVYIFEYVEDADQWGATTRLFPFDASGQVRFGTDVAVADGELWVGTPGDEGRVGTIYQMRWDADRGAFVASGKLGAGDDVENGDVLGAALRVAGDVAVATVPGDDNGAGTAAIFTRDAMGDWSFANKVWSEPAEFATVTGGQVDCGGGGMAAAFECSEVDLVAFLPLSEIGGERGTRMNDIWGWTDPATGREYALAGMNNATAFVDITDAENPEFLGELPLYEEASPSTWRDIKVYDGHAFIVADGAGPHGMQVFDLTRLRDVDGDGEPVTFDEDAHYDRIGSAHNIVINTESGFAYIVGAGGPNGCGGGLHMVDIRNPTTPRFAGCFADTETGRQRTGYSHDAQCVMYEGPDSEYAGREICLGANETALSISDVTDKENPVAISRISYPNVAYSHQGWLTEDHRYFIMNDELDEIQGSVENTRTLIWDLEELEDPQLVGTFMGNTQSTDHNLYIRGDLMYQSNYVSGLRVIDVSDPTNPEEVGYFDTVPYGDNTPGFGGSWSNYPFFQSGVIPVTSGSEGLFLVKVREPVT